MHAEATLRPMAAAANRPTARFLGREFQPSAQIAARGQIRGPGSRGGVDVHGDGSATAFTGRWRRREIAPQEREDAFQALRRVLS